MEEILKRNQKQIRAITLESEYIDVWKVLSKNKMPAVDFSVGQVLLVEFGTTSDSEVANIHISSASQGEDYTLVEVTTYETKPTGDVNGIVSSPFHLAFIKSKKPMLIRERYKQIVVI